MALVVFHQLARKRHLDCKSTACLKSIPWCALVVMIHALSHIDADDNKMQQSWRDLVQNTLLRKG